MLDLVAFAKVRKVTIGTIVSVSVSGPTKQLGSLWTSFREILYFRIFSKICRENLSLIKH
jgi:hypothetical protein